MEKYFEDIDPTAELSSDLEWMLRSGQVSNRLLLENLVRAYYAPVKRMALAILDEEGAAQRVLDDTFTAAMMGRHKLQGGEDLDTWVYRYAWRACRRAYGGEQRWRQLENILRIPGQLSDRASKPPESDYDAGVWAAFDELPGRERIPLLLQLVLDWPYELIASVLSRPQSDIEARVADGLRKITADEYPDEGDLDLARASLAGSLQNRWPYASFSNEILGEYPQKIEKKAQHGRLMQSGFATFKELALILIAMVVLILAIWGGRRYLLQEEQPAGSYQFLMAFLNGSSPDAPGEASIANPAGQEAPASRAATAFPTLSGLPSATLTPTPDGVYYIVAKDDTMQSVAEMLNVESNSLRLFNRIPSGGQLYPRQKLVIPGSLSSSERAAWTPVAPYATLLDTQAPPDEETLRQSLRSMNFNSVWFDAQILTYPDGSFDRPSEMHRMQAWVSQDRFLLMGGVWGEPPSEVMLSNGNHIFVARPGQDQAWFESQPGWEGDPPVDVRMIYSMVNLLISDRRIERYAYQTLGEGQVAGKDAWVVNEADERQRRQATLWVDKTRGMVLRTRQYQQRGWRPNSDVPLPQETIVLEVEYDVDFPQPLFDTHIPWRGGYAMDASGAPAASDARSPLVGDTLASKLAISDAPPSGYVDASGRLSFRFPVRFDFDRALAETEILVDGYPIGEYDLGVPWDLACSRSPSGRLVVFVQAMQDSEQLLTGGTPPFYLDLAAPDRLHEVADGSLITSGGAFAISPDGRRLAYWGCGDAATGCGVFIEDMHTHEFDILIELSHGATGFVWSPDGEALAMLGANHSFLVVSTISGEIIYKGVYDPLMRAVPPDAPVYAWGRSYPPAIGGLEACITPQGLSDAL